MKKLACFVFVIALVSCNETPGDKVGDTRNDTARPTPAETTEVNDSPKETPPPVIKDSSRAKIYSNKRFRNVTVEKTGNNKYKIEGEGQIFEANFGWVVEDGHNELLKGHQMTDAGAPEWGKFSFTIEVKKERPNSTLTLVLFESSAKDGSRQHELPIVLD